MTGHTRRAQWLCAGLAWMPLASAADKAVDADLLEFLGSVDGDTDWRDYLENADLEKGAKPESRPPVKPPAKQPAKDAGK